MSYDVVFAKRLREMTRPKPGVGWYRLRCTALEPLHFETEDGSGQFTHGENLTLSATAAARNWYAGDQAAGLLSGGKLLVLDKLEGGA